MSEVTRHILVRGRVQGVGYRSWIEGEANARGLAGWARNRKDGSVEAVFAGPEDAVDAMIAKCRHGPGMAKVDAIDEQPCNPDDLNLRNRSERFSVLPTL